MILKRDRVIQDLAENTVQSNHSVVVRHVYWFALIFGIGTRVDNLNYMGENLWNIMIVNTIVIWSRSLRVPLIMWPDEYPDTPPDWPSFSNKIDELISSMLNVGEQRPTILPMSRFVSSNSAAIWWGSNDTQLYNDLHCFLEYIRNIITTLNAI